MVLAVIAAVCVCVFAFPVSHHFGFGMMDAAAMVELALNWTRVPDQHRCQVDSAAPPRYRIITVSFLTLGTPVFEGA